MESNEVLFDSAHAALLFAFNFSSQQYDRPILNKIAAPVFSEKNGCLAGLDGAGQAGMIRAIVKRLGTLNEAILIARFAQKFNICECRSKCCSGKKKNDEFFNAVSIVSDHLRTTALSCCTSNAIIRREYVISFFSKKDERVSFDILSKKHDIHRQTVASHYAKAAKYLRAIEDTARSAAEEHFRKLVLIL